MFSGTVVLFNSVFPAAHSLAGTEPGHCLGYFPVIQRYAVGVVRKCDGPVCVDAEPGSFRSRVDVCVEEDGVGRYLETHWFNR